MDSGRERHLRNCSLSVDVHYRCHRSHLCLHLSVSVETCICLWLERIFVKSNGHDIGSRQDSEGNLRWDLGNLCRKFVQTGTHKYLFIGSPAYLNK